MDSEGSVDIYWARDAQEAHEIKGVLERAGIEAHVLGEMLAGATGELPMGPSVSPQVWVAKDDEACARRLCREWEQERDAARAGPALPWTCPRCGESVEGTFDLCWKCEGPRPADD